MVHIFPSRFGFFFAVSTRSVDDGLRMFFKEDANEVITEALASSCDENCEVLLHF